MQVDPIEFDSGQFSIYQYADSNPFQFSDSTGLNAEAVVGTASSIPTTAYAGASVGGAAISLAGRIAAILRFAVVLNSATEDAEAAKDECDAAYEKAMRDITKALLFCKSRVTNVMTLRHQGNIIAACNKAFVFTGKKISEEWGMCIDRAIEIGRRGR